MKLNASSPKLTFLLHPYPPPSFFSPNCNREDSVSSAHFAVKCEEETHDTGIRLGAPYVTVIVICDQWWDVIQKIEKLEESNND